MNILARFPTSPTSYVFIKLKNKKDDETIERLVFAQKHVKALVEAIKRGSRVVPDISERDIGKYKAKLILTCENAHWDLT